MIVAVLILVTVIASTLAWHWRPRPSRELPIARGSVRSTRVHPRRRRWVVLLLATVLLTLVGGATPAVAMLATVALRQRLQLARVERRRSALIAYRYPDLLDLLVLTIRSGSTPVQAVQILGRVVEEPIGSALVAVVRQVDHGTRFADAVLALPGHLGPIAQGLADTLALADRHGTPLAPMLDRLADSAREQRRRNADVAARQLPIRLSFPLIGCTLPSFVLLTVVPLMAGTLSSLSGVRP